MSATPGSSAPIDPAPLADSGPRGPLALIGALNVRLIIPAWIIAGATVKMLEAAPSFLPRHSIITPARAAEIDLQLLLAVLVAIEFAAAFAMILIPRLARSLAIMIMAVFCGVLVYEMVNGAGSCGCFGSKSPPPAAMLAIDGVMLLAALFLRPARERLLPEGVRWGAAAVLSLVMAVTSWILVDPGGTVERQPPDEEEILSPGPETGGTGDGEAAAPTSGDPAPVVATGPRRNPSPADLPQWWLSEDLGQYIGRPWTEFPLFTFMELWPSVPEEGIRFISFYGRTCSHCEELFYDLLVQPRYAEATTAIEVPFERDQMRPNDSSVWTLPATPGLEMMSLPLGPTWILSTPLDLRIEDGLIVAITEGGALPGESDKAEPLPHGPVWDVDPARLDAQLEAATAPAAVPDASASASTPSAMPASGDDPAPPGDTPPATPGASPAATPPGAAPPAPALASRTNPAPADLPQWWFSEDLPSWIGRDWRAFPLMTFMPRWPTVPTEGVRYVVFYRRDCDHCREMFEDDFVGNDTLARRTTAIEVPYAKDAMTPPGAWDVPSTAVERMQMPIGPDYIITTPLAMRIENGRIAFVEEGDHHECFGLDG